MSVNLCQCNPSSSLCLSNKNGQISGKCSVISRSHSWYFPTVYWSPCLHVYIQVAQINAQSAHKHCMYTQNQRDRTTEMAVAENTVDNSPSHLANHLSCNMMLDYCRSVSACLCLSRGQL